MLTKVSEARKKTMADLVTANEKAAALEKQLAEVLFSLFFLRPGVFYSRASSLSHPITSLGCRRRLR